MNGVPVVGHPGVDPTTVFPEIYGACWTTKRNPKTVSTSSPANLPAKVHADVVTLSSLCPSS